MSEGFAGGGAGAGGDGDQDADQLHDVMALATAHLGAVVVDRGRLRRAQRRHRLAEGGVAAGVLSVALVAAMVAMQGGGGAAKAPVPVGGPGQTKVSQNPTTVESSAAKGITPVAVSVYDSGDGLEGSDAVKGLLSGTGAWETYQYCQDRATYQGVPKSTGVVFDLGAATSIGEVTVNVGVPGASLEMWTADGSDTAVPGIRPNQPPAGFTKVAGVAEAGTTVVLSPAHPVTTRYVLVWFTGALPVVPNPNPAIACAHDDGRRYGDSITAVRFARG
ncbi:hypothetical protein ABH920_003193 [Catenulispora sp. EB89]|uniref:hypothetical protein n=1 Tax=Catenulispora sp. EB89 TaxID=3156257 RepID=UPI003516B97D